MFIFHRKKGSLMANDTTDFIKGLMLIGAIAFIYVKMTTPDTRPITNTAIAGEEARPLGAEALTAFDEVVQRYGAEFEATDNEVLQGQIRKRRGEELCRTFSSRFFRDWSGRVDDVTVEASGQDISRVEIRVPGNGFRGGFVIVDTRRHKPGDHLHTALLSEVKVGDRVLVAGELKYDWDTRVSDCFKETRLLLNTGMADPAFEVKLARMVAAPEQ